MSNKVKWTKWELTLKRQDDEGTQYKKVEVQVDGSWPDNHEIADVLVDDWEISVMTLLDTHYE